jgi:glycerol-3-phosphate dehydrogenase
MPFTAVGREEVFRQSSDVLYDIVVIGGGIVGCGAARDAASRGLKVLLLERQDIASGTSSMSSRLIHGGLRYLEHFRLGLVHESVQERWTLMKLAPHLVSPLEFLFPVYRGEKPGLGLISMGTLTYSALAAFRTPGPRKTLKGAQAVTAEPGLNPVDLCGAAGYFDCRTNDARLTLETAMDAHDLGAVILTYSEVSRIQNSDSGCRLTVAHRLSGTEIDVQCRCVVLAAGPWTDDLLAISPVQGSPWVRPTKGVHLVVRQDRLPLEHAVVMKAVPADGRVLFALPWGDHSYIGTTDTDFPDLGMNPTVTASDAKYLLDAANRYFPKAALTVDDIVSVWAGLRPLIAPPPGQELNPSDVSREEKIQVLDRRYVVVAGGKLTTYRVMARKVVDRAAEILATEHGMKTPCSRLGHRPLPGGRGISSLPDETTRLCAAHPHLSPYWVETLVGRYGANGASVCRLLEEHPEWGEPLPNAPTTCLAEVHYAVHHEAVSTIEDFLVRRTYIYYKTPDQGLAAAEIVARILQQYGLTDSAGAAAMLNAYRERIHAWKLDIRT